MKNNTSENSVISCRSIIYVFLFMIITFALIYILKIFWIKNEAKEESNLLNEILIDNSIVDEKGEKTKENKANENESKNRIAKIKKLKEKNPNIVGWIEIKDTKINYPVLQGSDNKYYMEHNYKNKKTEKGSIFVDYRYDFDKPSSNLLIYGHNLITGEMFKDLLKFSDEGFYKKHPIIRFTTVEKDSNYEILAVLKSRVYYESEKNVFRYYQFIDAKNKEQFNEFIKDAKSNSLYETGVNAKYGDNLITLSTCSYHVENGRFAVIGREK